MSLEYLGVYLNDHLAGSTAALELLTELEKDEGPGSWTSRLRFEIAADRKELEHLLRQTEIAPSTARQAVAWLTEKLAELKTRIDDRNGGRLRRLELIEALALGIDGKSALWSALRAVSEDVPALRSVDYARLIDRAAEQRRTVEQQRLQAAADALRHRSD
jgi:hypothetical protein